MLYFNLTQTRESLENVSHQLSLVARQTMIRFSDEFLLPSATALLAYRFLMHKAADQMKVN